MSGDEYLEELHKIRERMQREMEERGLTLQEYLDEQRSKQPPIRMYTMEEYMREISTAKSR